MSVSMQKSRLTAKQHMVLENLAKPCEIEGWKYGPHVHPFWSESRTYKSLIKRGLIARDDAITKTRAGWLFTAHLCVLTETGRSLLAHKDATTTA